MPVRKSGDEVVFYDQATQEWRNAKVERYIKGYGYQINYEDEGENYQVEVVSNLIKTSKPKRPRSRSRSRSRSVSRRTTTRKPLEKVLRDPSPEETKLIDDSKITIETRVNENGNESEKDKPIEEPGKPERKSRGRSRKKETPLVDWAWENVEGESESRTRDRRSRSRSRERLNVSVGEIVPQDEQKIEPTAEVETPASNLSTNPSEAETCQLKNTLTLASCPWYNSAHKTINSIIALFVPLFMLKYYDVINGSHFCDDVMKFESPLTWRQYWTSQPFVLLATLTVFLNRPIRKYFQPLQILGIAAYAHFAPHDYIYKWIPACAVGQVLTVYGLGFFAFYRHQKLEPLTGAVNLLNRFAIGSETICKIQTDLFHAGSFIGILISSFYVVGMELESYTLCATYQILSLGLNLFSVAKSRGFGLLSVFYSLAYLPFISTLLPRAIYLEADFTPDYWMIYASIIGFLIGLCQKVSSLNRCRAAPISSELLIAISSLLLCPISLKTLIVLPLLYFSF